MAYLDIQCIGLRICTQNALAFTRFVFGLLLLLIVILTTAANLASAQSAADPFSDQFSAADPFSDQFEGLEYDQLKQILKDAKFYRALGSSKRAIDAQGRCGKNREAVQKSRQQFDKYQAQNDANPTAENKRLAEKWQSSIELEIKYYKDCFANNLSSFEPVWAEGITTYDLHRAKFREMREDFNQITSLNFYISKLQDKIDTWGDEFRGGRVGQKKEVGEGKIAAITGQVEFLEYASASGWSSWVPARTGVQLEKGDSLRTGPGSSVTIVFSTANRDFIVNKVEAVLGPNTEIEIGDLIFRESLSSQDQSVLRLIRGTLRALTKNWGIKSVFSVRTGTSICGIRGTEVAISYDPGTDSADVHLDYGDAFVKSGGRELTLQPSTSVTISKGQIGSPRPLSASMWNMIVSSTGGGLNAAPSPVINKPQIVTPSPAPIREASETAVNLDDPKWNNVFANIQSSYFDTMRGEAIKTMREYQVATRNNDMEYLLSILADPEKSFAATEIRGKGLLNYVNIGEPIQKWQLRCAACWEDTDEGEICALQDRRYLPSKYNNKYVSSLYLFKRINNTSYITERLLTHKGRGRKLKNAMKKNNQVCDIDK
jgi:hypothetical protein